MFSSAFTLQSVSIAVMFVKGHKIIDVLSNNRDHFLEN